MDIEVAVRTCGTRPSGTVPSQDALAWYKVVGIELGLFVAILASLICGDLLVH
jgi:hypothetical protein